MRTRLVAGSLFVFLAVSAARTQTPLGTAFTYQGRLKDAGSPANGLHDLRFRLYDAPAGGSQVGDTLCADNVSVTDGLFTLPLDFGTGAPVFAGQERFLEIDVRADTGLNCANAAGFVTLTPRQELTAAPNALFALNADLLDGLDSSAFLQSIPVPLTLSGTSATHIIRGENATTASGASSVLGEATGASGVTYGGRFVSASTSGRGVTGVASAISGTTFGGQFQSNSTSGRGVFALATAATGATIAVYGRSDSMDGISVLGQASAATGITYGGWFQSDSTSGRGVFGEASAATGGTYGVYGQSASTGGRGIYGLASAATGDVYGVYGQSNSTSGHGVFGQALANSGFTYGGRFQSDSTSGRGVTGYATATSGTTYGVVGDGGYANGFAVYANGDMGASGFKSFRIDHPDDPANKYLLHYAAESPEVINFYSGKATLDGAGGAVVELPHYFAKINKDPRYTLTAIGAPMPMLHVAEEIDEAALSAGAKAEPGEAAPLCSFRIAGGVAGAKVSWEIKAVRNDRWVQKRGAPVEVEKEGLERGTYQHPELYGRPPEKGMDHHTEYERPSPPAQSEATPH